MNTPESSRDVISSDEALPEGWISCKSKSNPGKKYYFDRKTGSSLWTKPPLNRDNSPKNTPRKCKKNKKHLVSMKTPETDKISKQTSKRKSDGSERDNTAHKRSKREEEPSHSSSPSCSSSGTTGTPKTYSCETQRKSQELLSPSTDSNCKDAPKISPNCGQNRTHQVKEQRQNIPKNTSKIRQSPTFNELGCLDDDYNDMKYSPSQFFEASKLICSLQNHLADEKGVKVDRKDTFARIEEGITKESVEYSSKNHPATPPHFRKASEIVCTIKSRLNENISVSEKKPRHSTPANDRLAALRASLSQSAGEGAKYNQTRSDHKAVLFESKTNVMPQKPAVEHHQTSTPHRAVAYCTQKSEENMDVEPIIEMRARPSRASSDTHPVDNLVLVVDTNIFIQDIQFLKCVLDSYVTGYKNKPTLMVPWQVINELDRMKDNKNDKHISLRAKTATDYLYQVLPNSDRIKGQTLRDASNHIYPCELPDDEILNCCLQQSQRGNSVILLSNDKNLCTRASINSISAMGVREMKDLLRSQTDQYREGDLRELLKYYEGCIYQLLANILENEMRARYNNLWQHVLFKAPPWTLVDVLLCLIKHWIAVFSEVFPRIEPLIQQVKLALTKIHDKGPRVILSDINNFKELAQELASKCQIIPEYMELAKLTVERLKRDQSDKNLLPEPAPEDEERLVVNAFEQLWTAFSSYCAKLATMLGVNHQLDCKSENSESPENIKNKWSDYNNHIQSLAYALKRTLTANENSGTEPLHTTLSECLALIGSNARAIDNDTLRNFCLNNRNMIHEALVKFTQLTELLGRCSSCINNN